MVTAAVAMGFDVGGSSIKYGPVDVRSGTPQGPLATAPWPQPPEPANLFDTLAALSASHPDAPVGVALPSVVQNGVVLTAANVNTALIGIDAGRELAARTGRPVVVLNDADAAGLAEVHVGAARGVAGSVMVLTFGTGIGAAMFIGGTLVPNLELGHMEIHGVEAEHHASARIRTAEGLDWQQWAGRVNDYLDAINRLFWPELIVIGGGISDNYAHFGPLLRSRARLAPAQLGPAAGVVGAALAAAQGLKRT
jgi:polyphosphate glucokinase